MLPEHACLPTSWLCVLLIHHAFLNVSLGIHFKSIQHAYVYTDSPASVLILFFTPTNCFCAYAAILLSDNYDFILSYHRSRFKTAAPILIIFPPLIFLLLNIFWFLGKVSTPFQMIMVIGRLCGKLPSYVYYKHYQWNQMLAKETLCNHALRLDNC